MSISCIYYNQNVEFCTSRYYMLEMNNTVTKEETNYLRIANLLLRIAPPAVRVKFDSEFDPVMLQKTLNQSRSQKLDKLRKKRDNQLKTMGFDVSENR